MILPEKGHRLRIFVGESDKYEKRPLYEWIVQKAREHDLAGATVLKGVEGYGAHTRIHTGKILMLADDLPMVIEIVDTIEKIDAFMPVIDHAIKEGLATVEDVNIRFYRSGKAKED